MPSAFGTRRGAFQSALPAPSAFLSCWPRACSIGIAWSGSSSGFQWKRKLVSSGRRFHFLWRIAHETTNASQLAGSKAWAKLPVRIPIPPAGLSLLAFGNAACAVSGRCAATPWLRQNGIRSIGDVRFRRECMPDRQLADPAVVVIVEGPLSPVVSFHRNILLQRKRQRRTERHPARVFRLLGERGKKELGQR